MRILLPATVAVLLSCWTLAAPRGDRASTLEPLPECTSARAAVASMSSTSVYWDGAEIADAATR